MLGLRAKLTLTYVAIMGVLKHYAAAQRAAAGSRSPLHALSAARAAEAAADLPDLLRRLPAALARANDGLGRIGNIVKAMRIFAYPEQREMTPVDLNQAILATLTVARHEYQDVADVETDLGELPAVRCHVGEVNQAVLNLVVNAAHAVADKQPAERGLIQLCTRAFDGRAIITVTDNGTGIPDEIRELIFEPFFTTKAVGTGTGQGLAVVRSAIVESHGGQVSFETRAGLGTSFKLELPIEGRSQPPASP